jgi:hypothetical protein
VGQTFIVAPIEPGGAQTYESAPPALRSVQEPKQIVSFTAVAVTEGKGFTVTIALLDVAGLPVMHDTEEVSWQVILSPLFSAVLE